MPTPAPFDDLDVFLSTDEFAVAAVVTLLDGTTRQVRGIFDDPYMNAQLGGYEQDSTDPRLFCKWADTEGIERGCSVAIGAAVYDVLAGAQGDGTGMATLRLAAR